MGTKSLAAGGFKWRADEFYNRSDNRPKHMYAPDWIDKEMLTYKSMRTPVYATFQKTLKPSGASPTGASPTRPRSSSVTSVHSCCSAASPVHSPKGHSESQYPQRRPASVGGATRSLSGGDSTPTAGGLRDVWGWCLPPQPPPFATSSPTSGEQTPGGHVALHMPLSETSVWPAAVPPTRTTSRP